MIFICYKAVEEMFANNLCQRSKLDYPIYNHSLGYANLVLNGDPEVYL